MAETQRGVGAIDIVLRARREEVEYEVTFRANEMYVRELTSEFLVDHASIVARFRSAEPEPSTQHLPIVQSVALDGIGIDRAFLIERCIGDERETYARLVCLAIAWWFDEFERDAEPIIAANARLVAAVVHAAVGREGETAAMNRTDPARRVVWRNISVGVTW
jgi:hypothetical protein